MAVVRSAAKIAATFYMDPVEVLDGSYFNFALRTACANMIAEEQERQRNKK